MKSIYRLIITCFVLISVLIGNDSLKTGNNKSIQFSISDNILLTDKGTISLAFKRQIKENRCVRLGFGLSGSTDGRKIDNSLIGVRDYKVDDYHISLFLQYILSLPISNKIKPYIGSGPYLGYGYNYFEETYSYPPDGDFIGQIKGSIRNVGLLSNIGIEIFTLKKVCLNIGYNLLMNYKYCNTINIDRSRYINDDYVVQKKVVQTDEIYIIEPISKFIGISIYF